MEAVVLLTVAQPKGATHKSLTYIHCLNMPKTGGREDIDLAEMANLEVLITDIIQLDMDTDELIDCCWS